MSNFSIFKDENDVYSTFNFSYPELAFWRLARLMEFNTLLAMDTIKDEIAACIVRLRQSPSFHLPVSSCAPIDNTVHLQYTLHEND